MSAKAVELSMLADNRGRLILEMAARVGQDRGYALESLAPRFDC